MMVRVLELVTLARTVYISSTIAYILSLVLLVIQISWSCQNSNRKSIRHALCMWIVWKLWTALFKNVLLNLEKTVCYPIPSPLSPHFPEFISEFIKVS